jgi:hypothetical protein
MSPDKFGEARREARWENQGTPEKSHLRVCPYARPVSIPQHTIFLVWVLQKKSADLAETQGTVCGGWPKLWERENPPI